MSAQPIHAAPETPPPSPTWLDVERQHRWFAEMRRRQPVWLDKSSGCWHVFRYAEAKQVVTHYAQFSSDVARRVAVGGRVDVPNLLRMDPPQHGKYRALIAPAFTPRALEQLSPRIATITQELLDRVRPKGQMDVVADLAYPLPTTVIAEMLGVPTADRPQFKRWADELFERQISDEELMQTEEPRRLRQAERILDEMDMYFTPLLEERRHEPRDDLMSQLVAADVDGAPLAHDELVSFCFLLLLAGHITTTNLIGNAIVCLDAHPEAMDELRRQPGLMPGAIEEVLRYASPVWRVSRVALSDIELDDVRVPADAIVFPWVASANRDEAQFSYPERFDVRRSPNPHLAFGHGIHFCVGAPLARLEASIVLPMLLEQMPQLRRVPDVPIEVLGTRFLLGVKRLPVTFAPRRRFATKLGRGDRAHPQA
jgi:cytochrome P450